MPGFDGTGPWGGGPMTGGGRGYCAAPLRGRPRYGLGGGFGRSRGWRHRFWATGVPGWAWPAARYAQWRGPYTYSSVTPEEELKIMQEEAQYLETELQQIRRDMEELKKEKPEKKSQ
jgi:hypothetical protein